MLALKPTPQHTETGFTILLGIAFASLFIGQALTHITAVFFIIWLIITRPRLPLIPAFWWLLAFAIWEWASNFIGPYSGDGIEGGGIGYHFLIIFLPLCIANINYSKLVTYVTVGALASATLIWAQALIGIDLSNPPLRVNWDGGKTFLRAPGFTHRPWVTQFIHSMVFLAVFSHLDWRKTKTWIAGFALTTGVILPQIRAVIIAFLAALSLQLIFSGNIDKPSTDKSSTNKKPTRKRLLTIVVVSLVCLGTIAMIRPDFFNKVSTGNGRDMIFPASFEIFTQYPHTGIGGGEHFKEEYQEAWSRLSMDQGHSLYTSIGHAHNDILLLLVHHGWPALILWFGFVFHSLLFVWKYGDTKDKILYASLLAMHHIAGLSETYLDYSNTTYTIFLCYGLALHKPIQRYLQPAP